MDQPTGKGRKAQKTEEREHDRRKTQRQQLEVLKLKFF